jgi:hypothetical protein
MGEMTNGATPAMAFAPAVAVVVGVMMRLAVVLLLTDPEARGAGVTTTPLAA